MKKILLTILIFFSFISYSYSKNFTGFVINKNANKYNLQPISKSYKGKTPKISLNNGENLKIILYSHGTTRPQKREKCVKKINKIPKSLFSLNKN